MKLNRTLLIAAICAVSIGWLQRPSSPADDKRLIGPTEKVEISDASIGLLGRVDTGAKTTSLHAESIQMKDGKVSFTLVDTNGGRVPMHRPVAKVATIRSATGSEERIFVKLNIQHEDLSKSILVNLNDRSHMTYPLLLGRNWLEDDYLVDVSQPVQKPPAPADEPAKLASSDRIDS